MTSASIISIPERKIPVLVTAQDIMEVISEIPVPSAKDIYLSEGDGIVKPAESRLGRTLILFYRYNSYALGKDECQKYRDTVKRHVG